jgi:hypothetical protein
MATEAQIAANRRNAQLSTGPCTPAGRARSAMNACKSGIYAQSEFIPGEDPAELAALTAQYYSQIQPGPAETGLADQAIRSDWQLRRLARGEADIWTMSMTGDKESNRKKGLPEDKGLYFRVVQNNQDTFSRDR